MRMKKRVVATLRNPHLDGNGRPKRQFSSYWQADRFIERSNLVGMESYYCRVCRSVHIGHAPKDPEDSRKLSLFWF